MLPTITVNKLYEEFLIRKKCTRLLLSPSSSSKTFGMETPSVNEKGSPISEGQHDTPSLAEECGTAKQLDNMSNTPVVSAMDPNIVDFDGDDDPENPQNWPNRQKYVIVGLLSAMQTMV